MPASALVEIGIKRQTAKGTIATGDYTAIPRISDSLTAEANTVQSQVKTNNRMDGPTLLVSLNAAGSIESELKEEVFDDIFAGAFANEWDLTAPTEDTLTVDKQPIYYTIVKRHPYITDAAKQYHTYQDCIISNIALNIENQQIIGFTFDVAASDLVFSAAAPWTNLVAAATKNPLISCNAVSSIKVGGVEVPSIISAFSIAWNNNTKALNDVRSCVADNEIDKATVTGEVTAYHDDFNEDWFRDAIQNTDTSLEVIWDGETKQYTWEFPKISNATGGPDSSGDDVEVTMPWSAFIDSPVLRRSK